jgi:tetratricopeptide (TPR) repeat protein
MKNKNLLITISGMCALLIIFAGCGERSGEKEYNKAIASWEEGDLVRAQSHLEKAVRKFSGNDKKALASNQLGLVLWSLGKQKQAIERFGAACRLTEGLSGANLNLGIALYHAGELGQAEFQLTKILNEQPANTTALAYMGLVQAERKNWKDAILALSKSLRNNTQDPAGQNALALAELHLNRNSESAINRLKQLVAAYPDYAPATYNLAVIHDQWLDNKTAALGWYKQYLAKTDVESARTEAAKKAIARLEGDANKKQFTGPVKTDPAAAAKMIAAGSKLHAAKKYAEAVAQYEKALAADPTQKTAHYNMGLSQYELKNYIAAAQAFSDALKLDSGFANARYMLALSHVQRRQWDDAEMEANKLKESDPAKAESLLKYIAAARKR